MNADAQIVLLTGAAGFLGHYLSDELRARGLRLVTAGREAADLRLDLADPRSIDAAVALARPDLVLNCAAIASVAVCERQPALAEAVNARAPQQLAASEARMLQVSTDLVFDGTAAPYAASAATTPLSEYGRTKARAEAAVIDAGGLVVRVPLLFGRSFDGRRGATDMIRSAGPDGVTLFDDEFRTPLHAADAARGLVDLLLTSQRSGVVHLAGRERVSRYQLGRRFVGAAKLEEVPIRGAPRPGPDRPGDVTLLTDWDCGRSLDDALRAA